ncbi:MAG: hypothetical protein NTX55_00105 [Candidatus Parcubacteria bacterium]|nr:hypothetical protein [Candidatus Parcubacteria bacterium]
MQGVLERLFGSAARVKIIRLFLLNPETLFGPREISRRAKVNSRLLRREISLLKNIKFVNHKTEKIDELIKLKNGKIKNRKKKIQGLRLNSLFPFLLPLKNLLVTAAPIDKEKLIKKLNSIGRMKLIILSGVFNQSEDSKVDLLLVGDSVRRNALGRLLKKIEAETGKEIVYAVFNTNEFLYRFGMYDRFIRDILDYPHEKILNKLGV